MNKKEVVKKLKEAKLTEQDKIDIFNWYIKQAPMRTCQFQTIPGKEFLLSEQTVLTANTKKAKELLDYSIKKIKEYLDIK